MPILHLWEGFEAHKFYERSFPLSKNKHAKYTQEFSPMCYVNQMNQKKTNIHLNLDWPHHSIIEGLSTIGSIQCHLDAFI
jgi:hypothetical protein